MNKKTSQKNKGFTLIETFVAVTILVIVAIGPLSLLSASISDGIYAKNQIRAYYLAQEGMDLLVYKRNLNREAHKESAFDGFDLVGCREWSNDCAISLSAGDITITPNGDLNKGDIFARRVKFEGDENSNKIKVFVQVKWKNKLLDKTFTLSNILFDYDK